ncbi:hypothetical protein C8Q75DRAFT_789401 [Abortiporus biennis]|nr:hypothetical protein C8Q75DRAFT_789401 [Abortiporus biennis]
MSRNHERFSWQQENQRFQFAFIANRWDLVVRLPPWAWHPSGEVFRRENAADAQLEICPGQHNKACQSGNSIFNQLQSTCVADHSGPINGIKFGREECMNKVNEHGEIPSFIGSHLREFFLLPAGFRHMPRKYFTTIGGKLQKLPMIAPPNTPGGSPSSSKSSLSIDGVSPPRSPLSVNSDSSGSSFPRGGGSWIGGGGSRHSSPEGSTSSGEREGSTRRKPSTPSPQHGGATSKMSGTKSKVKRRMVYYTRRNLRD